MSSSTDLTFALYHAIAYLTRSLIGRYSATTIDLLHFTLERNLAKQYENNWFPTDPQRGSGRRCLSLSPNGTPPRPIYYACKSARVNWEDWMTCLGGVEMDLFVDPGCVSARFGKWGTSGVGKIYIVWSAITDIKNPQQSAPQRQTVAQSLVDDDDEDELFNMIADEIRAPTWMTPILDQFPTVPRPTVVVPSPSQEAQTEDPESATSASTTHSSLLSFDGANTPLMTPNGKNTRRERARQARVHVDATKTDVTPYDGGKTTVLTGGVMLGMKATAAPIPATPSTPRFSATPMAASRKTVWRNAATARMISPRVRV
ncbi:hypothetical protein JB92DRAFT_2719419 [Gautieria morchelliformis]|nr:hypothetical protein JB92DRAFT_2719419 [Gautieria morchelliformis]